jgi:putative transposase
MLLLEIMDESERKAKNAKIAESYAATKAKRATQSCRVFQLKVQKNKLSASQREALSMMFVEAKWLVNAILSWSETGNSLSSYSTKQKTVIHLDRDKNPIESEFKYLGSQMKQSMLSQMISNIKALGELKKKGNKVGKLKYRSECKSIDLKQHGVTYSLKKNKVHVQGIPGWFRVSGTEQFLDKGYEIANAKLLNTPKGYFLAVSCYRDSNKEPKPTKEEDLGIDLGCETAVTLSDGRKFKAKVKETDRLKRLQKKLARQVKRSGGWRRTKRLIGVEYQKITDRKDDLANKIIHEIKQYQHVYMQDELLNKWKSNGHGKAVQYSVLGRVKSKVKKFAANVLSASEPTTKLCYNCGQLHDMPVSKRVYECNCGLHPEDRDVHSAKNMIYISKGIVPMFLVPGEPRDFMRVEPSASALGPRSSSKPLAWKHEAADSLDQR